MSQTKRMSLVESCTNIGIGYTIAIASQYVIFPVFDIHIPLREHMVIGIFFTFVSLIRSYWLRRLFNQRTG